MLGVWVALLEHALGAWDESRDGPWAHDGFRDVVVSVDLLMIVAAREDGLDALRL